jgi:FMN-dependent NADH-azoreductase
MKLLHIDTGITGPGSVSRQLSTAIVEAVRRSVPVVDVRRRDLEADPIPHLDSQSVGTLRAAEGTEGLDGEVAKSAPILKEFLEADIVVIGAPMYNFGMPSQLKAWFDRILVAGKTFRYTANGPEGLAAGKKVIIASARGGIYTPGTPQAGNDFHEPHLRALFRFIGIDDIAIVRAEGIAISPEHREAALNAALAAASHIVAEITPAMAA